MNTHVDRLWTERVAVGKGKFHVQTTHNRKSEVNSHPEAGKPYQTASLEQIIELAQDPQICEKDNACWMLASTYNQPDARTFSVQTNHGQFAYMLIDVDNGNHSLEAFKAAVGAVLPSTFALINSTASATPTNRKWHATIPLGAKVPYRAFKVYQLALFSALSLHGIKCDETLARPAQLFFLPSKKTEDAYYEQTTVTGDPYDIRDTGPLYSVAAALYTEHMEADAKVLTATRDGGGSHHSIIDWICRNFSTEDLLEQYGYTYDGKEWASPYQQASSSGHATMVRPNDSWFSFSHSDMNQDLGLATHGGRNGDAFDLIQHYAFGGSRKLTLEWARELRRFVDPPLPHIETFVRSLVQ
jgi:hypothetical protein